MFDKFTKYLGIDYGEKRVGLAVSDENKKYSFSRDYINNDLKFYAGLLKLIKDENISKIILGYPLSMSSEKTRQTIKVEDFKNALEAFLKKNGVSSEIVFYDERFTSKIAESLIRDSGRKKSDRRDKGLVDSGSAQLILQDYIDKENKSLNNN